MSSEVVKPSEICAEGGRALDLTNNVSQPFCKYFSDSDILSYNCSEKVVDPPSIDTVRFDCSTPEVSVTSEQTTEVSTVNTPPPSCTLPSAAAVPQEDVEKMLSATCGTSVDEPPHLVRTLVCGGCQSVNPEYQCMNCKSARYCSKECQRNCWEDHKTLCESIQKLSEDVAEQRPTIFLSHITEN